MPHHESVSVKGNRQVASTITRGDVWVKHGARSVSLEMYHLILIPHCSPHTLAHPSFFTPFCSLLCPSNILPPSLAKRNICLPRDAPSRWRRLPSFNGGDISCKNSRDHVTCDSVFIHIIRGYMPYFLKKRIHALDVSFCFSKGGKGFTSPIN